MNDLSTYEPTAIAVSSSARAPHENNHNASSPPLEARFRKRFAASAQEFVLETEFRAAPGFTILFGQPTNENTHNASSPPLEARFRKRFAASAQEFVLETEFRAAPGFTILFG